MEVLAKCAKCGSENLREPEGFGGLLRVTSDSRIWVAQGRIAQCIDCGLVQKPITPTLAEELTAIYSQYDLYFQGAGKEQKVFINGIGQPRSELLLDYFFSVVRGVSSNAERTWLDLGCGKGNLLRAMSLSHPGWKLFGADQGEKNRSHIEGGIGIEGYIAGGIEAITESYDVISLSHVLEHISDPLIFLESIRSHLNGNGYLLIAVPNLLQNPFDLLVADHCLHFSISQLTGLVEEVGFEIVQVDEHALPKELVLVARQTSLVSPSRHPLAKAVIELEWASLAGMVDWLLSLVEWGKSRKPRGPSGIFGTALAATWLDQSCGSNFAFFVDEDVDRSSAMYLGREVLLPASVPSDAEVLVPLPGNIAVSVSERLRRESGPKYITPPPNRIK
jgi:2-polyprenyl-3-methyl-5-hydroxy-6-metoxy-1,4-benzoquinol methylase